MDRIYSVINESIYTSLEKIFNRLDEQISLKVYSFILNSSKEIIKSSRIKYINGKLSEVDDSPHDVLRRIGFEFEEEVSNYGLMLSELHKININRKINKNIYMNTLDNSSQNAVHIVANNQSGFLYSNFIKALVMNEKIDIVYLIYVEDCSLIVNDLIISKPQLSFPNMVLNYFFHDFYYADDSYSIIINDGNDNLRIKYKEDEDQFLQRIARLFLGKLQFLLEGDFNLNNIDRYNIDLKDYTNQLYINNLLEKIEGVSHIAYEGKSPFGTILIMSSDLIKNKKIIKYSIEFDKQQPISWDDTRRIRMLLEITNGKDEIYLIADSRGIYGIGEIDWSKIGHHIMFKIEFKGLSKYDLSLMTTTELEASGAHIIEHNQMKILEMKNRLQIISQKLVSLNFKNPNIGLDGFTDLLLERSINSEFNRNIILPDVMDYFKTLFKKAIEQKSGAIVVITEYDTVIEEMKRLINQAIPIIPTAQNPHIIKYLTSIEGAMYFDTTGTCHAIGVILDGLSDENIGKSGRGARYNFAYRYYNQLNAKDKGCVIAVISEDGMIEIIPEPANEVVVRNLIGSICSYIEEYNDIDLYEDKRWIAYEQQLEKLNKPISIDYLHYLKLGDVCASNGLLEFALKYYDKGLTSADRFIVEFKRKELNIYTKCAINLNKVNMSADEIHQTALKKSEEFFRIVDKNSLTYNDHNDRAILLKFKGESMKSQSKKQWFSQALFHYTEAISITELSTKSTDLAKSVLYGNRGNLYIQMERKAEGLKDYMIAEMLLSNRGFIHKIKTVLDEHPELEFKAIEIFSEIKKEGKKYEELELLLKL